MLTSVHIRNFRSCRDAHLDGLGDVIALVGRNGAGKTNILRGILAAANLATFREGVRAGDFYSPIGLFSVVMRFHTAGISYEYSLSLRESAESGIAFDERLVQFDGDQPSILFNRKGTKLQLDGKPSSSDIGALTPAMVTARFLLPKADPLAERIMEVDLFLKKIRYYPLSEQGEELSQSSAISRTDYEAWASTYEATREPSDSVPLRLIYLAEKRPDDLKALVSLIGKSGLNLVENIEVSNLEVVRKVDPSSSYRPQLIWLSFCVGSDPLGKPLMVELRDLALGTRRVLRMLLSLIFDRSSVLLIEQPEDGLHPSLTRSLIDVLRQNAYPSQIILSSHSPVLLNQLAPDEVQLITLHDGSTTARSLDAHELKVAEDFINEDGPLSDFLESLKAD